MNKVNIFDVCGTITKTNNTYSFLFFCCKRSFIKRILFYFYIILYDFFSITNYKKNYFRLLAVRLLKGYKKSELEKFATEYSDWVVMHGYLNQELVKEMEIAAKNKEEIMWVTASIDVPVKALGKKLGVSKVFASKLEFVSGVCTGKVLTDLLDKKVDIIRNNIGESRLDNIYFYSDNFEDIDIIKQSTNGWAIYHTKSDYHRLKEMVDEKKLRKFETTSSGNNSVPLVKRFSWLLYVPPFFYFKTRPNSFISIVVKELFPMSILLFLMNTDLFFIKVLELIFIYVIFYSFYEIGIYYNDVVAINKETEPTLRVAKDVFISPFLFVLNRLVVVTLLLIVFRMKYGVVFFSFITLLVLVVHSIIINRNYRLITFVLLRSMKAFIPSYYLITPFFPAFLILIISQHFQNFLLYCEKVLKESLTRLFKYYIIFFAIAICVFIINGYHLYSLIGLVMFAINYLLFINYRYEI